MNELKPCPWCGDTLPLEIITSPCECGHHDWVYVECARCGATGPRRTLYPGEDKEQSETQAVDAWNSYE